MMTTAGVCPSSGTATPGYQRALENVDASEQSGLAVPEDGHTPASPLPPTGCVSDPGLTGISGHAFSFINEVLVAAGQKIEKDRQNQIDGKELHTLQPIRPAISADFGNDKYRNDYRSNFRDGEFQIHGMTQKP